MEILVTEKQEEQEAQASQILITFIAPGASEFSIQMQGVSPNQILTLSSWLQWKAHSLLDKIEAQRAASQIAVPTGQMPPDIRGRPS